MAINLPCFLINMRLRFDAVGFETGSTLGIDFMIKHFLSGLLTSALAVALFVAPPALADGRKASPEAVPEAVPKAVPEAVSAQAAPNPPLWVMEEGDSTVYLFGSMHLLKPDVKWRSQDIEAALEAASHLVMEVALDAESQGKAQAFMFREGMYPPDQSLNNHLPEDLYTQVVAAGAGAGVPEAVIQRMRPWYASVVVGMSMIRSLGFDPAKGVEQTVTGLLLAREVPVSGLETIEEQLSIFATLPEEVQVNMVRDSLRRLNEVSDLLDNLTKAWVSGDLERLDEVLIGGFEPYPELYKAVIVERNRRWLPEITALLDKPGTHLVVVGTAHLVGDDSVITMLRDQGVEISRE